MNISNFFTWFISNFVMLASFTWEKLDEIIIYKSVSLLDFSITLLLITIVVNIIIAIPKAIRPRSE